MSMSDYLLAVTRRLEASPLNPIRAGIVVMAFMLVFMGTGFSVNYPDLLLLVFNVLVVNFVLYGILLLGLNLQYGYAGLVNFGPVLFFAVGAYSMAFISAESTFTELGMGMPWYLGILVAVVATVVVAFILALSTIQLRDDYLAIVTLAAAEIFHRLTAGVPKYFGGETGIPGVPTLIADLARDPATAGFGSFVVLGSVMLISYGIVQRLGESPYGRVLRGIRDDEDAVKSLGKNVFTYKFHTFIIGSILMGIAGALLAINNGAVAPGFITIDVTVLVWIGMLIGGAGNNRAVLGGLLIISSFQLFTRFGNQVVPVTSSTFASLRLIVVGLLLIVIIRYKPEGLWGNPDRMEVD